MNANIIALLCAICAFLATFATLAPIADAWHKRGGIWFARYGRVSISVCRSKR